MTPTSYLLAEDGSRITDNDDGAANLDARVERDLAPGVYLVEATTVGGRKHGSADFTLSASRDATLRWQDPEVQGMVSGLRAQASCGGPAALRGALDAAGVADVDGLLALDGELCAAEGVDAANSRFLQLLSIGGSAELRRLLAPETPVVEPPPLRFRIIAMRIVDARIELGVELAGGEQVLPSHALRAARRRRR